jgi:geranylgeranyl pyrophosphate synthase
MHPDGHLFRIARVTDSDQIARLRTAIEEAWANYLAVIAGRGLHAADVEVEQQIHRMEAILAAWEATAKGE